MTDTGAMPIRLLFCVMCALCVATVNAEAQEPEQFNQEIAVMFWSPTPDFVVTDPAFAPVGGTVDFVNTFNIDDKRFIEYRFVTKAGQKHKIRFSKVKFDYEENAAVVQGVPVAADIQWELWRFGYEYDIFKGSAGFLGIVTELKYSNVQASIAGALGSVAIEQKVPVPTVGGIVRGYLGDYVSLTGEYTFLSVDREDYRGKFYDLDLYAIAHFGKTVGAQFGYRKVHVDYLVDDDQGDLKMEGVYFGGVVRF